MIDQYEVTVRRANENERDPQDVSIQRVSMVTLDEFGTLTIEAVGTIRSFPRGAWQGFSVTRVERAAVDAQPDLRAGSAPPQRSTKPSTPPAVPSTP